MDFNEVVLNTIDQIQTVLAKKADEYATSKNRFHNFESAGRKQNCTPEKALLGMMVKHVVAVDDLVNWIEQSPYKLTQALIDEKIGDNINYLILLKGMLLNRVEYFQSVKEIIDRDIRFVDNSQYNMEDKIIQEEASRDFPDTQPEPEPVFDAICKTVLFPEGTTWEQKISYAKKHTEYDWSKWRDITQYQMCL